MKHLIVAFALLLPLSALPCGNEYEEYVYTRADGSSKVLNYPSSEEDYAFSNGFDRESLLAHKKSLKAELKEKEDYKKWSDYALVLLKLGDYVQGLKILQKLIRKYPYSYNIVANLGTAYELNGQNDSAFKYISRAVKINPNSHQGSEWIHVKILQGKMAMEKDPGYLNKHSILSLSVVPGEKYTEKEIENFDKTRKELTWQLRERTSFVPAPDAVVADLLYDLANLIAVTEYVEASIPVYKKAFEYGPADPEKVSEALKKVERIIYFSKLKKYTVWTIPSVAAIGFIFWLIMRKRRKKKQRNILKAESAKA